MLLTLPSPIVFMPITQLRLNVILVYLGTTIFSAISVPRQQLLNVKHMMPINQKLQHVLLVMMVMMWSQMLVLQLIILLTPIVPMLLLPHVSLVKLDSF